MNKRKIAIIDCDNFYVSCERVFNPISVGKPTVVLSNNDGCVIARSKEAKDLKIKMGEPYFEKKEFMDAHNFCVYSSNYNLYGDMSDRVMSTIKKFTDKVEVYSIDESFVDFSNIPDEDLMTKLNFIRDEVKRQVGITVSIGVGPNKTLAKITSHIAKQKNEYNGICSYWTFSKDEIYSMSIDEVWGIGRQWSKKLKSFNINNIGDFLNMNNFTIRKILNVNGLRTKMELEEQYCFNILEKSKIKKNLSTSRSFGTDVQSFNQISEAMYNYITYGVKKLKSNRLHTNKATIFISGNKHKGEHYTYTKVLSFRRQTSDIKEIWNQIQPELLSIYQEGKKYKKCGVTFYDLVPDDVYQKKIFIKRVKDVEVPQTSYKLWEMKAQYLSQKYTTEWNELPLVF